MPQSWAGSLLGYGWSFATITPAIFETSDLLQALLPALPGNPWKISPTLENTLIVLGAACLIVPLVLPQWLEQRLLRIFVWIGFVLLLDPINHRLALPSLLGDLSEGFRSRAYGIFFSPAGFAAGYGNFGTIGHTQSGITRFPFCSDGRYLRCLRPVFWDFCLLRLNVS